MIITCMTYKENVMEEIAKDESNDQGHIDVFRWVEYGQKYSQIPKIKTQHRNNETEVQLWCHFRLDSSWEEKCRRTWIN